MGPARALWPERGIGFEGGTVSASTRPQLQAALAAGILVRPATTMPASALYAAAARRVMQEVAGLSPEDDTLGKLSL